MIIILPFPLYFRIKKTGAVAISDIRRRKRYLLVDAGKSIFKVINLPLKHVLGGLRKLFLKVRRNKVEKYHQQEHGEEAAPETTRTTKKPRVATFVDLDQLTAEETAIVEEVYQGEQQYFISCIPRTS